MKHALTHLSMVGLLCTAAAVESRAHAQHPQDFARGVVLIPETGHGVYRTRVPEDAYLTAVSPALADLAVFNGRDERIPHAIRAVADRQYARQDSRDARSRDHRRALSARTLW